jgi:CBS domain containing-hemolysin-like protein
MAVDCREAPMLAIVGIIVLLIAINALYVAAEFAAVSVSTSRMQRLAERGGLARRMLPYLRDARALDRYIAASQIGITVSSLVLGAYGQATLAPELVPVFARLGGLQHVAAQSTAAVVVLIGLTVIQMVLGELVPKTLALQYPTRAALWTVLPMQGSLRLMSWFIAVLNGSGGVVLRLFGFQVSGHRHIHSPEEIEFLLAESSAGGLLEPHEHRRLRRALRLGALRIDEILVPRIRIAALDIEATPEEALARILESPFTRLPVYRGTIDDIIGFIHTKDIARQAAERAGRIDIAAVMRPVLVVPMSMKADQVLVRMREERRQLAIVLDEFGGTAGLVTIENILEQVIGEIVDEFKAPAAAPERLPDGRVRLPGDMHVDELEPWLGTILERGDTHTIGGRGSASLGRLPRAGERVVIDGLAIEVETVANRAVQSVVVAIPDRRAVERDEEAM